MSRKGARLLVIWLLALFIISAAFTLMPLWVQWLIGTTFIDPFTLGVLATTGGLMGSGFVLMLALEHDA